eukprot:5166441-Prymnesium_polylepis.2
MHLGCVAEGHRGFGSQSGHLKLHQLLLIAQDGREGLVDGPGSYAPRCVAVRGRSPAVAARLPSSPTLSPWSRLDQHDLVLVHRERLD